MAIRVRFDGVSLLWRAESLEDVSGKVFSLIREVKRGGPAGGVSGSTVWLSVVDEGWEVSDGLPSNFLGVSIDSLVSCGALIWYVTPESGRRGGVYEAVWISDGPADEISSDGLIIDPYVPTFHDPASVLKLSSIVAAVDEFCKKGDGSRPQSVEWIQGDLNGWRSDRVALARDDANADPWA